MNKNFRLIQLSGMSGILILSLLIIGTVCGFILFPIWMIMNGWNFIVGEHFNGPTIDYLQATLLWGVAALSLYLVLKNKIAIKIEKGQELSDMEIKKIISDVTKNQEKEENEETL